LRKLDHKLDFQVLQQKKYFQNSLRDEDSIEHNQIKQKSKVVKLKTIKKVNEDYEPTKDDEKKIYKKIRTIISTMSNLDIFTKKENDNYTIVTNDDDKKITLKYEDTLNPDIFPWYKFEKTINKNLTAFKIYQNYRNKWITNPKQFRRIILKQKNIKLKKIKEVNSDTNEVKYCICNGTDNGEPMVGKILSNFRMLF
jgi:hypothetical protein